MPPLLTWGPDSGGREVTFEKAPSVTSTVKIRSKRRTLSVISSFRSHESFSLKGLPEPRGVLRPFPTPVGFVVTTPTQTSVGPRFTAG